MLSCRGLFVYLFRCVAGLHLSSWTNLRCMLHLGANGLENMTCACLDLICTAAASTQLTSY